MSNKTFNYQVKQVGPESDRTLKFTGTSEVEDRDGDVILTEGIMTSEYMSNPVFMVQHDYKNLPCGKTLQIIPDMMNRKTTFVVKFPTIEELSTNPKTPSDHALLCDTVYKMYKSGYLNAVSIGFHGVDWEPRMATNGGQGRLYKKINLFELSAVCVPSNPQALISARAAGVLTAKTAKYFPQNSTIELSTATLRKIDEIAKKFPKVPGTNEVDLSAIKYTSPRDIEIDLDAIVYDPYAGIPAKYADVKAELQRCYIPSREVLAAIRKWQNWAPPEDKRALGGLVKPFGVPIKPNMQESERIKSQMAIQELKKARGW